MDVLELTDANFHQEVGNSATLYLVDFWAVWCGPCRMMAPVVEEVAKQYAGRLKVGKLNVDNEIRTAEEFRINSIPTLIIFSSGKERERLVGAVPKDFLVEKLEQHLGSPKLERPKKGTGKEKK